MNINITFRMIGNRQDGVKDLRVNHMTVTVDTFLRRIYVFLRLINNSGDLVTVNVRRGHMFTKAVHAHVIRRIIREQLGLINAKRYTAISAIRGHNRGNNVTLAKRRYPRVERMKYRVLLQLFNFYLRRYLSLFEDRPVRLLRFLGLKLEGARHLHHVVRLNYRLLLFHVRLVNQDSKDGRLFGPVVPNYYGVLRTNLDRLSDLDRIIRQIHNAIPGVLRARFLSTLSKVARAIMGLAVFHDGTRDILLHNALVISGIIMLLHNAIRRLLALELDHGNGKGQVKVLARLSRALHVTNDVAVHSKDHFHVVSMLLAYLLRCYCGLLNYADFVTMVLHHNDQVDTIDVVYNLRLVRRQIMDLHATTHDLTRIDNQGAGLINNFNDVLRSDYPVVRPTPADLDVVAILRHVLGHKDSVKWHTKDFNNQVEGLARHYHGVLKDALDHLDFHVMVKVHYSYYHGNDRTPDRQVKGHEHGRPARAEHGDLRLTRHTLDETSVQRRLEGDKVEHRPPLDSVLRHRADANKDRTRLRRDLLPLRQLRHILGRNGLRHIRDNLTDLTRHNRRTRHNLGQFQRHTRDLDRDLNNNDSDLGRQDEDAGEDDRYTTRHLERLPSDQGRLTRRQARVTGDIRRLLRAVKGAEQRVKGAATAILRRTTRVLHRQDGHPANVARGVSRNVPREVTDIAGLKR